MMDEGKNKSIILSFSSQEKENTRCLTFQIRGVREIEILFGKNMGTVSKGGNLGSKEMNVASDH